jgi:CHAD domain-containing protein
MFDRIIEALPEIDGTPAGRRSLLRALTSRRQLAREKMLSGLQTPRFGALLAALVEAARSARLKGRGGEPAVEVLPGFARRPWRRLRAAVLRLDDNPSDDDLHAVRIAAKKARYAAEALEPLVGAGAGRYAAAVAGVQAALGDYHDSVVARSWLAGVGQDLNRGAARYIRALTQRELEHGQEALDRWPGAWQAASKPKRRRWMKDA